MKEGPLRHQRAEVPPATAIRQSEMPSEGDTAAIARLPLTRFGVTAGIRVCHRRVACRPADVFRVRRGDL